MAAKDIFVNKMNLVSKDDYQILKKIVEKQNLEIKKLKQRLKRKK